MLQHSNLMIVGVGLYCIVCLLAFFEGGLVTLSAKFRRKGASPTNMHCWCQKTRVIALSCGIKISAVHCLVLSQSRRVTDRRTDVRTEGQNYDSQDRASIAASRRKMTQRMLSSMQSAATAHGFQSYT